jgi:signal transduction histidine kinase
MLQPLDPLNDPLNAAPTGAADGLPVTMGLGMRLLASISLQGKLIIAFMVLLMVALGSALWLYSSEAQRVFWNVLGGHAIEVAHTLGMASERQLARHDVADLDRIAHKILKNPAIATIAYYDSKGLLLDIACRDPDIDKTNPHFVGGWKIDKQQLLTVRRGFYPSLGNFAYATVPVIQLIGPDGKSTTSIATTPDAVPPGGGAGNTRLIGYVTVAITQAADEQRLATIRLLLVAMCALVVLLSLPVVSMLVHRIFTPIRQLVTATHRIAQGDLSTRVAVHRRDVIGDLARAFNEMVIRVKQHQDELAGANARLEVANRQLAEANHQLAVSNRDLEGRVRQRTIELEMANRRLSSEIGEKEEFLRAISHDLNAPLRNIAGMASMLLLKHRPSLDPDAIHRLERIQKNVEVESDLINELLELSRIKTHRLQMEIVDPTVVIRELADVFENDLRSRGITLHIDTELPSLHGERARVRQVFQNLVDNAIKYMGDGPTRGIHIGCHLTDGEAQFYVRDTGLGIEEEDLPKVFQVFRRGKGQAVQNIAGKGIGLASVKSIVETFNGTIWVESKIGEGTTFRFTVNGQFLVANGGVPESASQRSDEVRRVGSIFAAA